MKLHNKIFIGIIIGVIVGLILNYTGAADKARYIQPIGQIFIKMLKMIIIPLIMASMIMGVASAGDVRKCGRIGVKTLLYYFFTTGVAVALGLILVNLINPGGDSPIQREVPQTSDLTPRTEGPRLEPTGTGGPLERDPARDKAVAAARRGVESVLDLFKEIIPDNPFKAITEWNMLPIIFVSLLLGGALTTIGEKGKPVIDFFDGLNEAMIKITGLIMRFAPIGAGALVAHRVAITGPEVFEGLLWYSLTVMTGLLIHGVLILPMILKLVGRECPLDYMRKVSPAISMAFSTSSSSATLPITLKCVKEQAKVSPRVANFVLPLGATINMDGTALYEAVAVMFIAQSHGIEMTAAQQIIIFITATLAAIGAAGVPSAGFVTMGIVLSAVHLNIEWAALVWAVDRILDMCRTTINVWGDCVGASVVAATERTEEETV